MLHLRQKFEYLLKEKQTTYRDNLIKSHSTDLEIVPPQYILFFPQVVI